ncbi:MAG: alpha/beta fold hydrolase [Maritimibacter sp.]
MFWIIAILPAGLLALLALGALRTKSIASKARTLVPPSGKFINISTGKLHYTDQGSGQPILLIHGLGGQLKSLTQHLVPLLESDFRVISLDRPGMGYSERPPSMPADIASQAGYVEEVIDALGLERPIVLGHSLGGAISAGLALRAPDKVAALALIAPLLVPASGPADAFKGLAVQNAFMRRLIAATVAVPASVKGAAETRAMIFGPEPITPDYDIEGGGQLSFTPKSFLNASRDFTSVPIALPAQSKRYDEITCPVRVLYGTEDQILSFAKQGEGVSARYKHFRLTTLPGAGHMLPLTQPEAVATLLRELAAELAA